LWGVPSRKEAAKIFPELAWVVLGHLSVEGLNEILFIDFDVLTLLLNINCLVLQSSFHAELELHAA
jgi:hypothetical protein